MKPTPCPKCGSPERKFTYCKGETWGCPKYSVYGGVKEHLDVTCQTCGFVDTIPTLNKAKARKE
jgi:hypothetical protein